MQMASVAVRLLPFLATSLFYIVYWIPSHDSKHLGDIYQAIIAKCLPIISLCGFVVSYIPNHPVKNYPQFLLAGLIFSSIGDAFLVFGGTYFLQGLLSFAIGHLMFTSAFGFSQYKPELLLLYAPIGSLSYTYLMPGLQGELLFFCALYILLICTMSWRAIAKANLTDPKWPEVCGCLGAISFNISDMVLSVNKFRFAVPYGNLIIMSTYYLGQLGISLSVVPTSPKKTKDQWC